MSDNSKKFHYEVNNQNLAVPEILIYGYIGQWEEVDYKRFQNTFREILSKTKELTVRMHCGGGSVYEGLAIYDLMRSSDAYIKVIVEGMAASMGSIIALGGDEITMTENAFFMMHSAKMGCYGTKASMLSAHEQLTNVEIRLVEIYKERISADDAIIASWFTGEKDTWLDSTKCLEYKICDEVIKPTKKRLLTDDAKDIVNKTPEEMFAAFDGEIPNEIKNQTEVIMKQRLLSMLAIASITNSLSATSNEDEIFTALDQVFAKAKRVDEAEAKINALALSNATTIIEAAIVAGKLTAAEKQEWIDNAINNPEMVEKALSRMIGKVDPNDLLNRDGKEIISGQHELLKNRADWDFEKWQKEDPNGLAKLEDEAPEDFKTLFNKKFNK